MRGSRSSRLVLLFPVLLLVLAPTFSSASHGQPHVVAFVSTSDPTFTFASVGNAGVATQGALGLMTVTCVHVTTIDLTHQLVRARATVPSLLGNVSMYFTFYGNGLIDASWTTVPDFSFPCGAGDILRQESGVGVIAP